MKQRFHALEEKIPQNKKIVLALQSCATLLERHFIFRPRVTLLESLRFISFAVCLNFLCEIYFCRIIFCFLDASAIKRLKYLRYYDFSTHIYKSSTTYSFDASIV